MKKVFFSLYVVLASGQQGKVPTVLVDSLHSDSALVRSRQIVNSNKTIIRVNDKFIRNKIQSDNEKEKNLY